MKKTIRVTAKKVDDAISQGLEILGVTIVDAEVRVISEGGLFKKAEVEISVGEDDEFTPTGDMIAAEKPVAVKVSAVEPKKEKPADKPQETRERPADKPRFEKPVKEERPATDKPRADGVPQFMPKKLEKQNYEPKPGVPASDAQKAAAEAFLQKLLSLSKIEASVQSEAREGLEAVIQTTDSAVIGHRGEMLDALQHLTAQVVNAGGGKFVAVTVDALGYRERRIETLRRMAQKAAEKCLAQGRRVSLDSMNSGDRKEIHAYLAQNERVVTRSEGSDPNRRIVIYPAK